MKTTRIQISWQRRTRITIVVLPVKITLVPSKLDTRLLKHNPPPSPQLKQLMKAYYGCIQILFILLKTKNLKKKFLVTIHFLNYCSFTLIHYSYPINSARGVGHQKKTVDTGHRIQTFIMGSNQLNSHIYQKLIGVNINLSLLNISLEFNHRLYQKPICVNINLSLLHIPHVPSHSILLLLVLVLVLVLVCVPYTFILIYFLVVGNL